MNTCISNKRFSPANKDKMSALEIQTKLKELKGNHLPERVITMTQRDVFGQDENKYSPALAHLTTITVDGRSIAIKGILRGLSNKPAGEMPSATDLAEMSKYFTFVSKSLRDAAKNAKDIRNTNADVRLNSRAITQLQESYRDQYAFEQTLNIPEIITDEELQNKLLTLAADNAELKKAHSSLASKVSKFFSNK